MSQLHWPTLQCPGRNPIGPHRVMCIQLQQQIPYKFKASWEFITPPAVAIPAQGSGHGPITSVRERSKGSIKCLLHHCSGMRWPTSPSDNLVFPLVFLLLFTCLKMPIVTHHSTSQLQLELGHFFPRVARSMSILHNLSFPKSIHFLLSCRRSLLSQSHCQPHWLDFWHVIACSCAFWKEALKKWAAFMYPTIL